MKTKHILAAIAAVGVSSASVAGTIGGTGPLAGLTTNGATANGVSAVAIITDCKTRNAMQVMQDMAAACHGNNTKLCAPNISSAELRAIYSGNISTSTQVSGPAGTLAAARVAGNAAAGAECTSLDIGTNTAFQLRTSPGIDDALSQFMGEAVAIDGIICGGGVAPVGNSFADDASMIANIVANARIRFGAVHATSLSDTNNAGFVKVDGSAPDLVNLVSSNYNIVSNLSGAVPTGAAVSAHGTTFDVIASGDGNMDGDGVAYHNSNGAAFACGPASARGSIPDTAGAGL